MGRVPLFNILCIRSNREKFYILSLIEQKKKHQFRHIARLEKYLHTSIQAYSEAKEYCIEVTLLLILCIHIKLVL